MMRFYLLHALTGKAVDEGLFDSLLSFGIYRKIPQAIGFYIIHLIVLIVGGGLAYGFAFADNTVNAVESLFLLAFSGPAICTIYAGLFIYAKGLNHSPRIVKHYSTAISGIIISYFYFPAGFAAVVSLTTHHSGEKWTAYEEPLDIQVNRISSEARAYRNSGLEKAYNGKYGNIETIDEKTINTHNSDDRIAMKITNEALEDGKAQQKDDVELYLKLQRFDDVSKHHVSTDIQKSVTSHNEGNFSKKMIGVDDGTPSVLAGHKVEKHHKVRDSLRNAAGSIKKIKNITFHGRRLNESAPAILHGHNVVNKDEINDV